MRDAFCWLKLIRKGVGQIAFWAIKGPIKLHQTLAISLDAPKVNPQPLYFLFVSILDTVFRPRRSELVRPRLRAAF